MGKSRRGNPSTLPPEEDPRALKKRDDEIKERINQLQRQLEEHKRLNGATITREEIDAQFEEYERNFNVVYGPAPSAQRWLDEQGARRYALDRWKKEERPKLVAELQHLREEQRQLEQRFRQAIQQGRQPRGWTKDSPKRAAAVETVRSELNVIRSAISDGVEEEDLARVRREHPHFLVWKIIRQSSSLHAEVVHVRQRRQLMGLAQKLAAFEHKVAVSTVKYDWSHRRKGASSKHSK